MSSRPDAVHVRRPLASGVTMDAVQASPTTTPGTTSLWSELREALRGTHRDLTETPLGRAIFILAVPMVLEMVME